jgi:hypothetical protein
MILADDYFIHVSAAAQPGRVRPAGASRRAIATVYAFGIDRRRLARGGVAARTIVTGMHAAVFIPRLLGFGLDLPHGVSCGNP